MNFVLHGHAVSGGITIGYAHLVTTARLEVVHYEIPEEAVEAEVERFEAALAKARQELDVLRQHIPADAPQEFEAFLNLHRMILDDSALSQAPKALIRERRTNAEWALVQQMERLTDRFDEIDDPYLRERKADVQQAVERVLKALMGAQTLAEPAASEEHELIVVAHDLSPADMILFKRHHFGGFITDVGGVTSHTAIVARSLAIPAIVGLHHAFQTISERELLIVDGVMGVVIVNPDPVVLEEYRLRQSQLDLEREKLKRLKSTKATTVDGTPVELYANIELPDDMPEVLEAGAEGVGLFRSEFIFLNRKELPSEEKLRKSATILMHTPLQMRAMHRLLSQAYEGQPMQMAKAALAFATGVDEETLERELAPLVPKKTLRRLMSAEGEDSYKLVRWNLFLLQLSLTG